MKESFADSLSHYKRDEEIRVFNIIIDEIMTGIMRNTSFAAQRGINLCKGFLERDGWSDTYGLGFFEEPDLS